MNLTTRRYLLAAGWGIYAGVIIGVFSSRRKYQKLADAEIESVKDVYARKYKESPYSTPKEAAETLGVVYADKPGVDRINHESFRGVDLKSVYVDEINETAEKILAKNYGLSTENSRFIDAESAKEKLAQVMSIEDAEQMDRPDIDYIDPEDVVPNVVFDKSESADPPGTRYPPTERPPTGDKIPYPISIEEFMEDNENNKVTLTYYDGDDVLTDERDDVVRNISSLIGDDFLINFGNRSGDESIVYVRNEKLHLDAEVVRDERKYTEVILGHTRKTKSP